MNTRQRWLAAALAVTLVAVFWPAAEDETVEPVTRSSAPRESRVADAPAPSQVPAASTERIARMQGNLFPRQSWAPPPTPYVAPPPAPAAPPPLPFQYLGRWVDDGKTTLFLIQGDQPIPVKPGQVLAGSWRVDEIKEREVVFTYLPLDMQSTLGIMQ